MPEDDVLRVLLALHRKQFQRRIQNFLLCRSFRSHCTLRRIAYLLLLCLPNGRLPSGRAFTKLQMTGHQVKFISFCKIPNNNERTACEYTLYRLFIRKWLRFHDCHSMQGRTRKQTSSKKTRNWMLLQLLA